MAETIRTLVVLKACAEFQRTNGRPPLQRELRGQVAGAEGELVATGIVPDLWRSLGLVARYPYIPTSPQIQNSIKRLGVLGFMVARGGPPREGRTRTRLAYTVTEDGLDFAAQMGDDPFQWPRLVVEE